MTKKERERMNRFLNNEMNEEDKKWIKNLNKYAEKCKKINSATCYETDKECANSIKNINKTVDLER